MILEFLYLLVLFLSLIINLIIMGFAWTRWKSLVGKWYIAFATMIELALLSYILFSLSDNHDTIFFWVRFRFVVLSLSPIIFFGFILVYTDHIQWLRTNWWLLLIIPIITIIIVWFAPHLFWQSWDFTRNDVINIENATYTGWFSVHALYALGNLLISSVIVLRHAMHATSNTRPILFTIGCSILVMLVISLLPSLGFTRDKLNPLPIGLSMMVFIYGWIIFRLGLLKLSPLAYLTIIENMRDAVFVFDAQNCLILLNESGKRLIEIENRQTVLGKPVDDVFVDRDNLIDQYKDLWEAKLESSFTRKETVHTVDIRLSPILNSRGEHEYKLLVMRDITQAKQVEDDLRLSESQYRSLFEQQNDGVMIIGTEGNKIAVNQRIADMTGYTQDEILQSGLGFLSMDSTATNEKFARLLKGEIIPPYEREIRHKDGHALITELNAEVVYDSDDNPIHILSIMRDITDQKQAQQHAFDLALEKERHKLLTTFLQDASHEFRTPLSIISTNLYIITHITDTERQQQKVTQIQEQIQHINNLVTMMVKITKLDDVLSTMQQPVSLVEVIQSAVDLWQSRTSIPIHYHANLSPPLRVIGDYEYLHEVFSIFIDNAQRFGKDDNVIDIRISRADMKVTISIEDKGSGIPEETISHIFEAFWRSDTAHTTPGLGLGLSLAQKVIQVHNGTVEVQSEVGKGSRFDVILPIMIEAT
jgi:PAS domain S-box-containing protein